MIDNTLTSEITKRILINVGVIPVEVFGKAGITEQSFIIDKKIKIRYNDINEPSKFKDQEHSVYTGELILGDSKLYALLINLSIDSISEFILTFRMDSLPIYSLRWCSTDEENNFIKFFDEDKNVWRNTSIEMQAKLLANYEKIASWGLLWGKTENYNDLYNNTLSLIN